MNMNDFDNSDKRDYLISRKEPISVDEINKFLETDLGIHECELFDTANCRSCPVANCIWQGYRFINTANSELPDERDGGKEAYKTRVDSGMTRLEYEKLNKG